MKTRYLMAALLAVLVLSQWSACGNLSSGEDAAEDSYNVTYLPNGATSGTVPADSSDYAAGATVTVKGNTGNLVNTGSAFSGWNTQANGGGTTYTQGQTFIMGKADVRLYARWTTNPSYTVTYDGNGATSGTAPTDTTHYEAGQSVTALANTGNLVLTGCTFVGWNTQADGGGTDRAAGSSFSMGSANVTLFAKWETQAIWAQSVSAGPSISEFHSIAVDDALNLYVAGYQWSSGTFTYSGQNVAGTSSSFNVVLVKYDLSGTALWASTVSSGTASSFFNGVAIDGSENIYASGCQGGTGTYMYGSEVLSGTSGGNNSILVKYDSLGGAVWARTISAGSADSNFYNIAVDGFGNIYASGYQTGSGTYTYGTESIAGTSGGANAVLVKYDSSGSAIWARTVSAGSGDSYFYSVAVDASGNVYAAGSQSGTGNYTYSGETLAGTAVGANVVLVRYDSSGTALWARTVSAGSGDSLYYTVAADVAGNISAAGYQTGTGSYTYGTRSMVGTAGGTNISLVKYDSGGTVLWARTVSAGSADSQFHCLSVDDSLNIYAAGFQNGTGTYTYGSQNAAGAYGGNNAIVVKYDSAGTAQWARTVSAGPDKSEYYAVAAKEADAIYTAGYQSGAGTYTYGTRSAAGTYGGNNASFIKWRP